MNRHLSAFLAVTLLGLATSAPPAQAVIISEGPGLGETSDWGGVGKVLNQFGFAGTGTLISPQHVLTAAHLLPNQTASFNINGVTYTASSVTVHPQYVSHTGNSSDENDIAVITLAQPVPSATYYAWNNGQLIETTPGLTAYKVGWGGSGSGTTGENLTSYPAGQKLRAGVNAIDFVTTVESLLTDDFNTTYTFKPGLILYDFDNHNSSDTGPLGAAALSSQEGDAATGDSGAPMFQFSTALQRYVIVGVTSGGTDDLVRYGEIGYDTQVAAYSSWVAAQVPEPASATLLLGAIGLASLRRRRA